ncbi:MAG: multicomponent Na+:H+ antiporter subunit A [Cellvibrionaceae bacterium]|jgi:multicomponent Na+:H+ antiporter subunit A
MLVFVLIIVLLAALSPILVPRLASRQKVGWLALVPACLFAYALSYLPAVSEGQTFLQVTPWMPSLGLSLSFYIDGLSLLFVLLITGIGSFIVLYASDYMRNHRDLGRFFLWLFAFMAAMLGLVTADNLLLLFVFWELTSITSYMLIGFNHESEKARKLALQGLFVTVGGGLLLMTGVILLGSMAGTLQISEIIQQPLEAQGMLVNVMLVLILMGAFTKSAQFPFHFWLPNAMAAPTPVSAFLHSATMVKAGIFLMARLHPALGEQILWSSLQLWAGGITMILGGVLAYTAIDIKKALAYSTLMALGTLTFLLGIGHQAAMVAFISFLLAHSLYKASLFMLAGAIDHSAGTKDLTQLGGLKKTMPITFILMVVAALSLAGLPPVFGFIAKELVFEAALAVNTGLVLVAIIMACLGVAVAIILVIKPFLGADTSLPKKPHEASLPMLAGPAVLLSISLLFGLLPGLADQGLIQATVQAVTLESTDFYLSIWHGFNTALGLSALALVLGVVLAKAWQPSRWLAQKQRALSESIGPEAGYFKLMEGIVWLAIKQTRAIQNGRLSNYMTVIVLAVVIPVGYTLLTQYGWPNLPQVSPLNIYEIMMVALLALSTLYAVITQARFASIISLGVMGYAVALIFVHFSAPDLGITQVLVETLTVLLLVLVLVKAPGFSSYASRGELIRDAIVAISLGVLMTLLVLSALNVQWAPSISNYFIENSYELGKGRNIVNVILVDFRALDTLGEIFVLAIAALGVYSMILLRKGKGSP